MGQTAEETGDANTMTRDTLNEDSLPPTSRMEALNRCTRFMLEANFRQNSIQPILNWVGGNMLTHAEQQIIIEIGIEKNISKRVMRLLIKVASVSFQIHRRLFQYGRRLLKVLNF